MSKLAFQLAAKMLIEKYYPQAFRGGIEDSAGAASDLSMVLGALLAFSFRLNGTVVGRTILETIIKQITENAGAIDEKAGDMIRAELPKMLN